MSEDMTAKIEQLKDMLNNGQVSDNLQSMMSAFSDSNNNSSNDTQNNTNTQSDDKQAMLNKFAKILEKKNQVNDPRINLLNAMKPYLSPKRQERADNCMKILNYTVLSQILKEEDL